MRVMVSCGEASGDLYAGALVRELRALEPGVSVSGFGGPALAAAGAELVGDYRGFTVTGLVEVVRQLPRTWSMYRRLVAAAGARRPDVFVAIDFPDFNFRVAKALHALGVPVVYYIGPQLWAWRPWRLHAMRRFADAVLVIFPFEDAIYRKASVPVRFVGHPLVELLGPEMAAVEARRALGVPEAAPTVALLPGSRPNELREILPTLVDGAGRIARARRGVHFVVARAPHLDDHLFEPLERARAAGLDVRSVEGRTDTVLTAADVVVTASGTATVQTALHERPMVIVYRVAPLTYRLGIRFVRVSTYGMVNLIAGRPIVPELIQGGFTPDAVAAETLSLMTDADRVDAMRAALRDVKARLGGPGASRRAAESVLDVARGRPLESAAAP